MEDYRRKAGQELIRLRELKGWNQEDLAHAADLSVKTVSRFENGRHEGRRGTVRALADALGVSEFEITGTPPNPLGLGGEDDQLDRIEAKLDRIITHLGLDEEEARRLSIPPGPGSKPRARRPKRSAAARQAS